MNPENLLTTEIIEESIKIDFGSSSVKLLSWSQNNCGAAFDNFFNVVKRIDVRCSIGGTEKEVTYIAKLNPCKPNDLFNPYRERAMMKEVFFYKELVPLLNDELKKMGHEGLHVPRYIHSTITAEKEVIILEDLKPKGFVVAKVTELDQSHSEIMAKEIAKLHVASVSLEKTLNGIKLDEKFPFLIESWLVGDEKLSFAFNGLFKKGLRHNLKFIKLLEEFKEFIPRLQSLRNHEMEVLAKELYNQTRWRVICHGDYHRNNVLFRYDNSDTPVDIMVIDWQTVRVANVGSEITYLLFSSLFGPSRSECFSPIINTYYEKLKSLMGTESPSLEDLEKEVKNNQFGFLLCFFLFPMSVCVSNPSELFKIEEKEASDDDETLESSKELLRSNERLNFILKDYLSYFKNNLDKFTF